VELASPHAFTEGKDEAAVHVGGENRRCTVTIASPFAVLFTHTLATSTSG
jgi:hypothetical protein